MNKDLQHAFYILKLKHGSHSAAARSLNISQDHYCAMRNGRANIPARTEEYITLKASEVSPDLTPAPPLDLAPSERAREQ